MTASEGRSCPIHYRYKPEELLRRPEFWNDDVVYVVGGLYGNPFALDEIEAMADRERAAGLSVRILFNGDFNWFNADRRLFASINDRVLGHEAMLGNVEYELANPGGEAGCGCAYPAFVDDGTVERSNRIMQKLQQVAGNDVKNRQKLGSLPRWRSIIFGGLKVLVLHGDPESLAGWGLSREVLAQSDGNRLADWFRRTGADVILCTHTCLPLTWSGEVDGRNRCLLNNGSAGMANLEGDARGFLVRLGASESPHGPVAFHRLTDLRLSLDPIAFDLKRWLSLFDRLWPTGSDAALSYRQRLVSGTRLTAGELYMGA
ncbi:MAG: hypothetical protein KGY54_11770 [Oleiphilaceae bacterium]|nr:hypothetical protein [Oleiphilaceae bacterium]